MERQQRRNSLIAANVPKENPKFASANFDDSPLEQIDEERERGNRKRQRKKEKKKLPNRRKKQGKQIRRCRRSRRRKQRQKQRITEQPKGADVKKRILMKNVS